MKILRQASLVIVGVCIVASFGSLSALADDGPSYVLTPWPYGAIAWVGGVPDDVQTASRVLADAVASVFGFWELPPPEPMDGWEDPSRVEPAWKTGQISGPIPQVVKKDPATSQLWRLNPLRWNGIEAYPLLYIAFSSRTLLAQGLGTTSIGGMLIPGSAALPGSEVWFQAITGVPMSIAAPASDGLLVAYHELAHWMTYLVCAQKHADGRRLPEFIVEGIAVYTAATSIGVAGWNDYASDWAEDNALSVEIDPADAYIIGPSVVQYLVESQGISGFLSLLPMWAASPQFMIEHMEDGWNAWLHGE